MRATNPIPRLGALLFGLWLTGACLAEPTDFSLPDLNGKEVRLADYRGQWVVVNFWASWCGPCIREIPELVDFQQRHPEVRVLGVNYEYIPPEKLRALVDKFAINYPVLRVGDTPLIPFEPLKGLPTTAILDPNGEILADHAGPVTREALEDFIAREAAR